MDRKVSLRIPLKIVDGNFAGSQQSIFITVNPTTEAEARANKSKVANILAAAGLDEAKVGRLARWAEDPAFTDAERAVLAVAEQFVIDVHGVSDADFARLADHLSPPECVGFTVALGLFDGASRLRIALGGP